MTTALIVPFGADDTENGRARQAIWNRCYRLWAGGGHVAGWRHLPHPHHLIVAGDPLFGTTNGVGDNIGKNEPGRHPFSVARAINRAVRLAPPEVDKFVCIGADALPDWRVVDWAAEQLETRPWTLLFGKGGNYSGEATAAFTRSVSWPAFDDRIYYTGIKPFDSPTVGPIAFTREAFLAVRGFDERFEGWAYEDVDFWSRLRSYFFTDDATIWGSAHEFDRVSPYPLIQFSHPTDHHDLTDGNPNVRLWRGKCADPRGRRNDHPAPNLFGTAR